MRSRGFTLIELLVVIAVIGVLAGMLMPALNAAKAASKQMGCGNALRQMQIGNAAYAVDHRGEYVAVHLPGINAWYGNPDFREVMEWGGGTTAVPRWAVCPDSWTFKATSTTLPSINLSYGANTSDKTLGTAPVGFRAGAVVRPADKMAFADSWDWWINAYNSAKFDYERKPNNTGPSYTDSLAVAYRHTTKVGIAFFDGHVEHRRRSVVEVGTTPTTEQIAIRKNLWYTDAP
jgi:prepilin-type N-terminal cleavage/methylation domain-containing protein/prepilin-type processing-associated H-X9-DG protein